MQVKNNFNASPDNSTRHDTKSVPKPAGNGNESGKAAQKRLAYAKFAYTTRRVPLENIGRLITTESYPQPGDLVLARVLKPGQHEHLELPNGRKALLYPGDEIVVTYANRYAPDQFEATVPEDLSPCHLVAAGGIAARMLHKHAKMKNPTEIEPLALLGYADGRPINLADYSIPHVKPQIVRPRPLTIAVFGTSMNSGKTTSIASLTRGLIADGQKVAAAKLSGTGAGGDIWHLRDAGADPVIDFVDAGVPSTYLLPSSKLDEITDALLACLFDAPVDFILVEISDGLLEPETARLINSPNFYAYIDAVIFTAIDSLGVVGGISWLHQHNMPVIGISGLLTNSPLAVREASGATDVPIYPTGNLTHQDVAAAIREKVMAKAASRRKKLLKIAPKIE